jgi:hypothetical protein
MKIRHLALFGAPLVLAQCQPACTPAPPAPVETTTAAAPPPVVATPPVIPLGVTVEAACSAQHPAIHVVNDSDQPIVFTWTNQRELQGGEQILEPWPQFLGSNLYLDEIDWDARDLGDHVFDSGTLLLRDAENTPECNRDSFSAALTFAYASFTRSGQTCVDPVTSVRYGIDADGPVGYDTLEVSLRLSTASAGTADDQVFNLPIASSAFGTFETGPTVLKTRADVTAGATVGGEALFHDADGALPDRAVALDGVKVSADGC